MGRFIGHTSCNKCHSNDNLACYEQEDGSVNGNCNTPGCGWNADPYGEDEGSDNEVSTPKVKVNIGKVGGGSKWKMEQVHELPTKDLTDRGIPAYIAEWYGVKTAVDTTTAAVTDHFYPRTIDGDIVQYKRRPVANKKGMRCFPPGVEEVDFIGTELARTCSRRVIFITEGECDMMATQYMLQMFRQGSKFEGTPVAVVSASDGGPSAVKNVKRQYEFLNEFEKVVYLHDNDKAGKDTVNEVCMAIPPGKAYVADYPEKDPNDALNAGKSKTFASKITFEHKRWNPPAMLTVADLIDKASTVPEMGLSWPWESLDNQKKRTFGIYPGLYMWGAGAGVGKTTIMMQLTDWITTQHNERVGLFYLEQEPDLTVRRLAGLRDNQIYHLPSFKFDPKVLRQTNEDIMNEGKITIYNPAEFRTYQDVVDNITLQVRVMGVKHVVLDNLTAATANAPDQRIALDDMVQKLAVQSLELGYTIHIVSHLNRAGGGEQGHEGGADVKQHHFRGSGGLQYWPNHMIGCVRDTDNENELITRMMVLKWLKDRKSGFANGLRAYLMYDVELGKYRDATGLEQDQYKAALKQQREEARAAEKGSKVRIPT